MRRVSRIGLVAAALLVIAVVPAAGLAHEEVPPNPEVPLDELIKTARGQDRQSSIVLDNFKFVGHSNLGGGVDFADVWAHGDYAYVGTSCGAEGAGAGGVRVASIAQPTHPRLVATLPNAEFTRAQDVVVRHVHTRFFHGDLAAVGIQACLGSGHEGEVPTGLMFYDVTNPGHPHLLSEWFLPAGSIGCHEIDLVQRTDGVVLAGCARQVFDQIDPETGGQAPGAVQFVNATDPAHPTLLRSWEMPVDPFAGVGCFNVNFAHSVRFTGDGRDAYVSYWDAGTVHLDLANPASPTIVSDTLISPPDEDADNHSLTFANQGRWLVINPEDFSPADCGPDVGPWGEAYVYDNSDPSSPSLVGTFSTANSRSLRADDGGWYTVHNTEVALERQMFSSWYSDGIVWWTMDDHGASRQLGQFVPPTSDAFGVPLVWGVYVDSAHDLILASDFGTGLWIIRPKGLKDF